MTTTIEVCSFSYKYHQDQHLTNHYGNDKKIVVIDCRKLANPHTVGRLKNMDGRDEAVISYVFKDGEATELVWDAFSEAKKAFESNDKSVVFAYGCVGGRHRSVACAETLVTTLGTSSHVGDVSEIEATHFGLKASGLL